MKTKEEKKWWVAFRNKEPCAVFNTRKEAVVWFKNILKQVLNDFKDQDKTNEYNYNILFKEIEIKVIEQRPEYLGS